MLAAAKARLRAAWIALTHSAVPAPAYVPALPCTAPAVIELPEPDETAPEIDIRAMHAARRCPAIDALTRKPNATLLDWRQWYEAHEWPDIPVTHSDVQEIRAMIRADLQCPDISDDDLIGPRGMFRPILRGIRDRDTRYRYQAAGADDASELDATAKRLLAFLQTRPRAVSGKIAAKALKLHHSNVSRAKDRLLAKCLIVEEKAGREVLLSVPRRTAERVRKSA
jgi:hypothetical protein